MTRPLLLCLAVTSLACSKKDRPHPRVAELTTPVHVTVRTIDFPDKTACVGGGPLERLKCWVTPVRVGATYVEVGPAADLPMVTTGDLDSDLDGLIGRSDTRTLLNRPVKKVKLLPDPASPERVVIDCGETGMVLFLVGSSLSEMRLVWDELASAPRLPNGELDWARVPRPPPPPLDLVTTSEAELEALAKTGEGLAQIEAAVNTWVSVDGDLDDANFIAAYRLLPADVQGDLELQFIESVAAGSTAALNWFERHPERQTPAYTDALFRSLEYNSWEAPELLRAIVRLKPPHLVDKACARVEEAYFGKETEWDGYLSETALGALALLVHEKAKCPWVLPLLEQVTCNNALSCLPIDADVTAQDEDGKPRAGKGLCTASERAASFQRLFTPPKPSEEPLEDLDLSPDEPALEWGPILLMAAEVQGPLPADFLKRAGRRSYLPVFNAPSNEEELDTCRDLYDVTPAQWACELPANITVSTRFGCRMEVDDVKKTLKLTSVGPPPL